MGRARFYAESLDDSTALVAVNGELDLANTRELRRCVETALGEGRARIVVDLTEASHIDSSGLAELITATQRARDMGGALGLVVTSHPLTRTLEIRGVDGLLPTAPTRAEAIAALP